VTFDAELSVFGIQMFISSYCITTVTVFSCWFC